MLIDAAARCPSQTPRRHRTTEPAMLPPALSHSPSRARLRAVSYTHLDVYKRQEYTIAPGPALAYMMSKPSLFTTLRTFRVFVS